MRIFLVRGMVGVPKDTPAVIPAAPASVGADMVVLVEKLTIGLSAEERNDALDTLRRGIPYGSAMKLRCPRPLIALGVRPRQGDPIDLAGIKKNVFAPFLKFLRRNNISSIFVPKFSATLSDLDWGGIKRHLTCAFEASNITIFLED